MIEEESSLGDNFGRDNRDIAINEKIELVILINLRYTLDRDDADGTRRIFGSKPRSEGKESWVMDPPRFSNPAKEEAKI